MQQNTIEDEDVTGNESDEDSTISVLVDPLDQSSEEAESTVSDEEIIPSQDWFEDESEELSDSEFETIREPVVEEAPEKTLEDVAEITTEDISQTEPEKTPVELPEYIEENDYISKDVFEEEVISLRSAIEDVRLRIDSRLASEDEIISEIKGNAENTVDIKEFNELKRDFNVLSKRLKGVLKDADATRAEVLDTTKIPPEVLEITYAKTLNDLYSEILNEFGENEASEIVSSVMDDIRQSVAGMNFLKFDDGRFTLLKLSEAVEKKLVSPKQIHAMYLEFVRKLSSYIPNYESRDFRSFVETGSREYTVDKITIHEKRLDRLKQEFNSVKEELARISEHFESISRVEDQCAEEIKVNIEDLSNITGKFNALANAVNSHTRFIKKLNENILETRSVVESYKSETSNGFSDLSSYIDSVIETRACQTELQDMAVDFNSFREQTHASSEMLKSQVEEGLSTKADSGLVGNTVSDLSVLRDEFKKLQEEVLFLKSANKLPATERVVYTTLYGLGTATLKKLENQINSDGTEVHEDELFATIVKLEKRGCVSSQKKGRYTYYSLII